MSEMGVICRVFPFAADAHGIWLRGDDAWGTERVPADGDVFDEVKAVLWRHGIGKVPAQCPVCTGNVYRFSRRAAACPACDWSVTYAEGMLTLLHSTSWHQDGPHLSLTFVAVVDVPGEFVVSVWPDAKPVSPELLPVVGDPAPHDAAEPPELRHADPLFHALRHLAFLRAYDAGAQEVLGGYWGHHLAAHGTALAGMYGVDVAPVELPVGPVPEPCI